MQKNSSKNKKIILKSALENSSNKKPSDLSIDYLQSSNFSTKITNANIYNKKYPKLNFNTPLLTNQNENYNTINDLSENDITFSKMILEYDIHISSLKKKLSVLKKNRKGVELNVINLKRKIKELQNEEKKSFKQLEYTKNYIKRIMQNYKNNKNYGTIITKINNIYQINKSPQNIKLNINNLNNYKTWLPSKNKNSNKKSNLSHLAYYTAIEKKKISEDYYASLINI